MTPDIQHMKACAEAATVENRSEIGEAWAWADHIAATSPANVLAVLTFTEAETARADRAEAALVAAEQRVKELQDEREAIICLLYTDEVFVGSDWVDFPDADKGVYPTLCAHVSNYGGDAEKIPSDQYIRLANMVKKHGTSAIAAWGCFRRGLDKPPKGFLNEHGQAALADFRAAALLAEAQKEGTSDA